MTQTYRIVGWMTDLSGKLTVLQWQEMVGRLNSDLNYVLFEVMTEGGVILGFIDQVLKELQENDFETFKYELEQICLKEVTRSRLGEYTLLGESAYIGCSLIGNNVCEELESIQTFKEFSEVRKWKLSFEEIAKNQYQACLTNPLDQKLVMTNYCYSGVSLLFTEIEDILRQIAVDLRDYSKGCFNGNKGRGRSNLLQSIRDYQVFASKEELEVLMCLLKKE